MKQILFIAIGLAISACAEKPREYVCTIAPHLSSSLSIANDKATYGRNTYEFCEKQGNYEIFSINPKDCDPKNRGSGATRIEFDRITGTLQMGFGEEIAIQVAICKQAK